MNPPDDSAAVYRAEVMHRRFGALTYQFRYRVFSLLLDIDRIGGVAAKTALFSHNRFNLLSFHDRDHLPPGHDNLRSWAESVLRQGGLDADGVKIRLLCFPRVLGWVFNPLSLWYCETGEGDPVAVIAEVRNTFGERHCYLLEPSDEAAGWPLRQRCAKRFHVSPFIDMDAEYAFRLSRPGARLSVSIREDRHGEPLLLASQTGRRAPFNSTELLIQCLRVPVQTLKVLAGIHWHALLIWTRGGRFHRKPSPPLEEVS